MARKTYDEANIAAIAERIRANTGGNSTYNTKEMAGGVDEVYAAGIAEGKQAEYDAFWDEVQNYGKTDYYPFAFCADAFTKETFKPKYDIRPTNAQNMFSYMNYTSRTGNTLDLVEHLDSLGVVLDFSKATSVQGLCSYNKMFTRMGVLDFSKAANLNTAFDYASAIKTIDKLILKSTGTASFSNTFRGAKALEDITIEGVIAGNVSFQDCPLTRASIESIISHLSDTTSGLTVTFKKTAKEAAFTADEWAALIATKSNWTISLV